ncbi:MAG TPA: RseA family anti-sigma factor [Ramlibacter sp.]|uniref:sigma-E factor negative regulatory protein n=1 Tax=Ramlibacter sp. TaxID=1917967 RepID=UPI002ED5055F
MKTTMDKMDNQEMISALADGQLRGEDLARAVQVAAADARAREAWCAYHVVGEVLRTGRSNGGTAPETFLAKLQQRLREEPTGARAPELQAVAKAGRPAANDWAWKLVAGVASVAAFGAVGWNLWGAGSGASTQLAAGGGTPGVVTVSAEANATPAMIRDARLDQLLQAHRQFGGGTALGTTSGFLHNAAFEGPAR